MLKLIKIENIATTNKLNADILKNTFGHSIASQIKKPVGIKNINKKIIESIIPPTLAHLFLLIVAKENRKDKNAHINKKIENNENQIKNAIDRAISYCSAPCKTDVWANNNIEYIPHIVKIIPSINHKKINILIDVDFSSILSHPIKKIKQV